MASEQSNTPSFSPTLSSIVHRFPIKGTISSISKFGGGLINDSYRVITSEPSGPDYVLQRINHSVFTNVDLLQFNIQVVTSHIRSKLLSAHESDVDRKVLQLIPTHEGNSYHFDGSNYWRLLIYVRDSEWYTEITAAHSYQAGKSFGNFEFLLSDLSTPLVEIIPKFHNMEFRLEQLRAAIAADAHGLVSGVHKIIKDLEKKADEMCKAERWFREGKLPKRICHCDTKINNMLFDQEGDVLCVIDLDTVMPSFVFSDFGDFMRTAGNTGREDDEDLEEIGINMEIFKMFTKGYLEAAGKFLTTMEVENLAFGARLMTYMQAVRFLTDYLDGSVYFKISYPEHNLVRVKAQMKLLQSMEEHEEEMITFIHELWGKNE
jgi:Ser/Thr protein kinase RdoA (MazF antagonist)